jgi:hypothetical protein
VVINIELCRTIKFRIVALNVDMALKIISKLAVEKMLSREL